MVWYFLARATARVDVPVLSAPRMTIRCGGDDAPLATPTVSTDIAAVYSTGLIRLVVVGCKRDEIKTEDKKKVDSVMMEGS